MLDGFSLAFAVWERRTTEPDVVVAVDPADFDLAALLAADLDGDRHDVARELCLVERGPRLERDRRRVTEALPQLLGDMRCERREDLHEGLEPVAWDRGGLRRFVDERHHLR